MISMYQRKVRRARKSQGIFKRYTRMTYASREAVYSSDKLNSKSTVQTTLYSIYLRGTEHLGVTISAGSNYNSTSMNFCLIVTGLLNTSELQSSQINRLDAQAACYSSPQTVKLKVNRLPLAVLCQPCCYQTAKTDATCSTNARAYSPVFKPLAITDQESAWRTLLA